MSVPNARVFFEGQAYAVANAYVTATASGANQVVASATDRIRVLQYLISVDSSNSLQWRSGSSSGLSGDLFLGVNGGAADEAGENGYLFQTSTGSPLDLYQATSGRVGGNVLYVRI